MLSGNTLDARSWTDGKMIAPMLPDRPWLVKCPKCKTMLWIDEAREVGKKHPADKSKKWSKVLEPNQPSEADFLNLLSKGTLTREKELYARRRAWWAANDAVRMDPEATMRFSPAQERNLKIMANLMHESDPDERITKAEILRELGMFENAVTCLAQPFDKEHHSQVAAFVRKLAEQKSRIVREIKKVEKPSSQPQAAPSARKA